MTTPLDKYLAEIEAQMKDYAYYEGKVDAAAHVSRLLKSCRILAAACDKIRGNPQRAATWTAAEAIAEATKALEGK